ncbi:MAG: phosphoribosylformylglycinamidine synthase subunit PurS [Acidimicrobiia bacterium]
MPGSSLSRFEARIEIRHRPGILDPEAVAVARALPALGYENVSGLEVGKVIRLVLEAEAEAEAREQVLEMCRRLLANPVIEDFSVELRGREGA